MLMWLYDEYFIKLYVKINNNELLSNNCQIDYLFESQLVSHFKCAIN